MMELHTPAPHIARQQRRIRWKAGTSASTAAVLASLIYGERN